jgi:phage N-6-adenine-methyltransferase
MAITKASKGTAQRMDWATPWPLFNLLNKRFEFTLDAAASPHNAKCARYFTEEQDGLRQSWANDAVFINPPYGRATPRWVEKAYRETFYGRCPLAVLLVVPRPDTAWWHEYVSKASKIVYLRGRVAFEDPSPSKRNSPPDPSCLVVFSWYLHDELTTEFWDWKAEIKNPPPGDQVRGG